MNVDGLGVFPPGTALVALPSWRAPRVLLSKSGGPFQRWRASGFYPATRRIARVYRLALRGKAVIACGEARLAEANHWILPEFMGKYLHAVDSMALQTRPSGPAQKFTIELRDRVGTVIGYVKYATQPLAQRRLTHEYAILARLPPGLGPTPLKFGNMGDGTALLVTALCGRDLPSKLPPPAGVLEFAKSLEVAAPLPLAAHPYVRAVRKLVGTRLDPVFEDLESRAWPIVLQHGDLAPWNLRWNPLSSRLRAFDWEFATATGFPYTDLAYFILQVALLVYSWPPVRSAIYATQWLERRSTPSLTEREARAVVRLAMFETYSRAKEEEYPDDDPIQAWRLRIWRGLW